jgi:hypothetical protein
MLLTLGAMWGFRQSLKFAKRNNLPLVLAMDDSDVIYVQVVSVGLFTVMVDVFDSGHDHEEDDDDDLMESPSWVARIHVPLHAIRAISLDDIERGRLRIEEAFVSNAAS